jgi:DNA-binding GntR family transcriptional regulator
MMVYWRQQSIVAENGGPGGSFMPRGTKGFKRVTTVDSLGAAITESILSCSYVPGEWFREEEMAAEYGVSRHTLRAALAELVQQGLLHKEPFRGVFVPRLTETDTNDLYRARAVFELEAARVLAQRGTVGTAALDALALFENLKPESPWSRVVEADTAFHRALIDELGSPRLSTLYSNLLTEFKLCLLYSPIPNDYPVSVIAKHRALVESITRGDPEEAVARFRFHIEDSKRLLIARYATVTTTDNAKGYAGRSGAPSMPAPAG